MDQATWSVLAKIAVFISILPLTIAIINRKNANPTQVFLSYLVLAGFVTDAMAFFIRYVFPIFNVMYLPHLYILLEFYLLGKIYQQEISNSINPKYIKGLIYLFLLGSIINSIFIVPITQLNSTFKGFSNLLFIIFSLVYFYQLLKDSKIKKLEQEPMFWFATGSLIYFSASLFIFIFSQYIAPSVKLGYTFWGIHALLHILLIVFYAIALWIKPRKTV